MSVPNTTRARTCRHWQPGRQAFCNECLAALHTARGYTSPNRTDDSKMQHYLRDDQTKAQQESAMETLRGLESEQGSSKTHNYGVAIVLETWGQQPVPVSYPYPTNISELEGGREDGGAEVSHQGARQQQEYFRPEPRRRPSNFTHYINPGPSDRRMSRNDEPDQFNNNSTHTRRPLRSITGTSAHNSRNSRSKSNHEPEVESGEDSGEDSDDGSDD